MINKYLEKLKSYIKGGDTKTFLVFILIAGLVTFFYPFSTTVLSVFNIVVFSAALLLLAIMAGHVVTRSLFKVGAGLSLVIFLAQFYCSLPMVYHTGDTALHLMLGSSTLYLLLDFLRSVYKKAIEQAKSLRGMNKGKQSWLPIILFALFTGLFVYQIGQVIWPILMFLTNSCFPTA